MMKHPIILSSILSSLAVSAICLFITMLTRAEMEQYNTPNALEGVYCVEQATVEEKETETVQTVHQEKHYIFRYICLSENTETNRFDTGPEKVEADSEGTIIAESEVSIEESENDNQKYIYKDETQEEVAQPSTPHYSIAGHIMPLEWQDFLYKELQKYGTEELAPYLQAQALQESRFNHKDITDGLDYGLFQYRLKWWKDHCEQAGIYGDADIFNPYIQIRVRANLASKVYLKTGSIEAVMKRHMNGTDEQNARYWLEQVSPWFDQIVRIN